MKRARDAAGSAGNAGSEPSPNPGAPRRRRPRIWRGGGIVLLVVVLLLGQDEPSCRDQGLTEGWVVWSEGPSTDNPYANHRLEVIDLSEAVNDH